MNFRFRVNSKLQFIEFQNGEHTRRLERASEPFEVTEAESRLLKGIEDIEPVPLEEPPPPPPPPSVDVSDSQLRGEQQPSDSGQTEETQPQTESPAVAGLLTGNFMLDEEQ